MLSLSSICFCHRQSSLPAEKKCEKEENAGESFGPNILSRGMAGQAERNLVRILIGAALGVAAVLAHALAEGLTDAHDELEQLRNETAADRTQPKLDLER